MTVGKINKRKILGLYSPSGVFELKKIYAERKEVKVTTIIIFFVNTTYHDDNYVHLPLVIILYSGGRHLHILDRFEKIKKILIFGCLILRKEKLKNFDLFGSILFTPSLPPNKSRIKTVILIVSTDMKSLIPAVRTSLLM